MSDFDDHRELFARRARQVVRLRDLAAREHQERVAVARNKPTPEEARFAVDVERPCDCGDGE